MWSLLSIDNLKIGLRRLARIAQNKSRDENADSPQLKEMSNNFMVVACSSRRNNAPFLPEEIILNILLWFPAEVLYNVMRYVCRQWYNVITEPGFINAHLQNSTDGLLIQSINSVESVHFVEIHNSDILIRKFNWGTSMYVYSSCDGLFFYCCNNIDILYVGNPITKQQVTLPPLCIEWWCFCSPCLTCVCSNGRYKVVVILRDLKCNEICLILTLGTDNAWRRIVTKHLPNFGQYILLCKSLATGGYIYLTRDDASLLFALDVEAEIFHQFPVPNVFHKATSGTYIVWKSFLTLVAHCARFVWEVWGLTGLNTGEWTRLFNIDLRAQRRMIVQIFHQKCFLDRCLVPIASLKNGEVVIFRGIDPLKTYLVYNLKTGEVSSFVIGNDDKHTRNRYECHVNSLVSWKVS